METMLQMLEAATVGVPLAVLSILGFRAAKAFMTERSLAENDVVSLMKTAIAQGKEIDIPYRVKGEIAHEIVKITGFDGREIRAIDPASNESRAYSWNRIDTDLLLAALAAQLFVLEAVKLNTPH
jgi:hypothetical protein